MKREPTDVVVTIIVKHVDEKGKIVGVRESEKVKIPCRQFEDINCQMVYNTLTKNRMPINRVEHRRAFIKVFQRWIVDNFLTKEK